MAYFTKNEARAAASERVGLGLESRVVLAEAMKRATDSQQFDIFLSHSSKDADLVLGVVELLERTGRKVYVDWIVDTQLDRSKVTKNTARQLRKRMGQCKSLIYMATDHASNSKWMPWELGYFDGLRKSNVAIMPLTDTPDDTFQGQEYLGLYPEVTKSEYTDGEKDLFVEESGQRWTTLARFSEGVPNWQGYSTKE